MVWIGKLDVIEPDKFPNCFPPNVSEEEAIKPE